MERHISRNTLYGLTAAAAILYLVLSFLFARDTITGPFWNGESWLDSSLVTLVLLVIIIAAGVSQANALPENGFPVALPRDRQTPGQVPDPRWWQLWMGNVLLSFVWLPFRFFTGREWLGAGLHKMEGDAWLGGGAALKGFWTGAVAVNDTGTGKITYDWYRDFLQFMLDNQWYTWFAKLVVWGEILIGIALLLGVLTGLAAFFGSVLNFNFGLAGTASSNPVLFGFSVLLVLAWRVAGWWGLDRVVMSWFGIHPNPVEPAPATEPSAPIPGVARR